MTKTRLAMLCGSMICSLAAGTIMGWEGKSNKAYLDLVMVPTICWGTTHNVRLGDIKTDDECHALLITEIHRIDAIIDRKVKVKLKDHERAALISFMYNVGETAFYNSATLHLVNQGKIREGCNALATKQLNSRGVCHGYGCGWAGGKMVRGLQNRRLDEKSLCLGEKNDKS